VIPPSDDDMATFLASMRDSRRAVRVLVYAADIDCILRHASFIALCPHQSTTKAPH
jgi:hypothetical protein